MRRLLRKTKNAWRLLRDAARAGHAGRRMLIVVLLLFLLSMLAAVTASAVHGLMYTLF